MLNEKLIEFPLTDFPISSKVEGIVIIGAGAGIQLVFLLNN